MAADTFGAVSPSTPARTRMAELTEVYIHADESCLGNQYKDRARPGGAAGILETWRGDDWVCRDFWVSEPDTTNNRMAIRSALEGLGALTRRCRVHFVSDSKYLVDGASKWIHGWKKRGWTRKGGVVENVELWKALDRVMGRHQVDWHWVRGHAGHPRNEYANDLAVAAATDLSASGGLVESGFPAWLEEQREKDRYLDFMEFVRPTLEG